MKANEVQQRLFNYFAEQHGINLMDLDFNEIENYMKPELTQNAIEFAEWCVDNNFERMIGLWYHESETRSYTTSELFDKFMEERSAQ